MGTALRNPGQVIGLLCDSANVSEGAALVRGAANDSVKLPGAANSRETFVGIAYQAGATSANKAISVILNGIFAATASGAITRGDWVTSGGTDGGVITETAGAGVNVAVIGQALESAVSGDRVLCTINPFIKQGG